MRMASFAASVALTVLVSLSGSARAETVDVAVVLAADVSRSIDDGEFQLQRKGYAAAITSPKVLQAIHAGMHGSIALCFVEWAGPGEQALVANWAVIRDEKDAAAFADTLLKAPRSFASRTAIGEGINFAVTLLDETEVPSERRVIDVSGDGTNNSGRPVTIARDEAVKKNITINGLAIINEQTSGPFGSFSYRHTHPPGGLPVYYNDNVIGGTGAFVVQVVNFDTFSEAITSKLLSEISSTAPPSSLAAVP
jgi:hypothetical protein